MELDGADFQLQPWDGSPGTLSLGKAEGLQKLSGCGGEENGLHTRNRTVVIQSVCRTIYLG
jgi:hypothetical protein